MSSDTTYTYDKDAADKVVRFFETYLTHVKGELGGMPLFLEGWQKKILRDVFGWKRQDGTRKYRTVYIEIPRKNGKSSIGSGVALYLLLADGEPGAEIYSAAADRMQAGIIFDIAVGMINNNDKLRQQCHTFRNSIVSTDRTRFYKPLSSDAENKHGYNAHGIIFDELHTQPNRELYDVLRTSTGARRQPLTWIMTTAGYDKSSICWEVHEYARKVSEGSIVDDSFYSVIFAADRDADIYDKKTWQLANPGYGTIVKEEYILQQVNQIRNNPSFENTFRRLHLNQWTTSEIRWITDEAWMMCATPLPDLTGRVCYGGIDLSNTTDVSALVLFFPGDDDEPSYVMPFFWIPEDKAYDLKDRDRADYLSWSRMGLVELTPGNVIDHKFIRQKINDLAGVYNIQRIGYDPWNAVQLVTSLMDDGVPLGEFRQGFASMSAPTKQVEALVLGGKLAHGGNPVLRWMASNVMLKTDPAGNVKVDKSKSTEKVDGIIALVMAVGEAMTGDGTSNIGGLVMLEW